MKKILTASLVAIMAVTAARAEIASTDYVTTRTGNVSFADAQIAKDAQNLTEAVKALDTKLGTVAGSGAGSVSEQIDDKINALDGAAFTGSGVVTTVTQENGIVSGTKELITDAVVDSISIGKVSGLQGALDAKQTVGNMILDANASADATKNDDTRYLSAKATYTVADEVMKAKSDALELMVTNLSGEVDQNASDIDGLINGDNSVSAQINAAKTEINQTIQNMNNASAQGSVANKIQTVETNLGTVSAENMGTEATTVVGAIKEVATEAAAAQTAANNAQTAANKAQGEVDALEGVVSQQNTSLTTAIGNAKAEAIAAAAADAETKADAALASAKTYAEEQAAAAQSGAEKTATDAIAALDANPETAGVNDGSYVTSVAQADGKITVSTVAFDSAMNANSTNAVQNKVVKAALDAKANDADLSAVAKLALPAQCANGAATCALVYDPTAEGKLKWESIME